MLLVSLLLLVHVGVHLNLCHRNICVKEFVSAKVRLAQCPLSLLLLLLLLLHSYCCCCSSSSYYYYYYYYYDDDDNDD